MKCALAKGRLASALTLFCLLTVRSALAQTDFLSLSSGTTSANGAVSLNLNLTSAAAQPAAIQWMLAFPSANITSISAVPGAALTGAGKTLTCMGSAGSYTCVAYGLNSTTIASGVVATVNLTVAAGVTSTSIGVLNGSAASVSGTAIGLSSSGGNVTGPAGSTALSLTSLSCTPGILSSGGGAACTVTLSTTATSATTVSLSDNNALLTTPASITVAAGARTASFTVKAGTIASDQSATVSATLGGVSQTATVNLSAPAILSSLTCTSIVLGPLSSSTCTVTLSKAATAATTVTLADNNALLTTPTSVTIAAGATTANFVITALTLLSDQSAIVTAALSGISKTLSISLSSTVTLSSLTCTPTTLGSSASSTCTVALTKAATAATTVTLSDNSALLTTPASVTIPANATTTTFTVKAGTITSDQSAIVTATLSGASKTSTISLAAATTVSSLTCTPTTLGSSASSTCTVALTKAATAATTVTLSDNNALLTTSTSVTIAAGATTANFAVKAGTITSDQSAIVTATLSGVSKTFAFTLAAPTTLSSLVCTPTTLSSGASSTCTVALTKAAPTGGTAVKLSDNSAPLTSPASVTVAATATTAKFTATAGSVTSDQSAVITATLGSVSKSATFSLAAALTLSSLKCTPATLGSGASGTCTVTLSKAASGSTTVTLSDNNAVLTTPGSVSVASGAVSANFTVAAGTVSATQSAVVTATLGSSSTSAVLGLTASRLTPTIFIDAPLSGTVLSGTTAVTGWVIESTSGVGASISSVQVLVDGVNLGSAIYGISRTDVCAIWPGRPGCPFVGFTYALNTASFSSGTHSLTVLATDTVGVSDSTTININIADTPPTVTIDGPDEGSTVAGTITVSGWALDNVNETGVAITSINVLVDGSVVGKASYGVSRPDVCAIWPGRPGCPNVGYVYSLNTATLSPGSHTISVSAVNARSITGTAHVTVTVGYSSPTVQIDSPTSGSVVSGKITVSGWAIDSTTTIGTAISSVKILVDGNTVGTATYGVKRTDVCVLWPGRPGCPNVGYSYSLNTAGLSAGSHILTVTATNSGPNPTTGWSSAAFTIGSGQTLTLNSPTAGSVVNGMITVSGWTQHLASRRMNSPINITVDGNLVGTASSDNSRPDGCRLHHSKLSEAVSDAAAQADCTASGFVYLLDTQNLTPGLHLLTVSTAGTDGTSDANSWTVDFTVPEPGGNL